MSLLNEPYVCTLEEGASTHPIDITDSSFISAKKEDRSTSISTSMYGIPAAEFPFAVKAFASDHAD